MQDPAFEALLHHIQESRGLDFRGYKRTSLKRRITLRMEAVGVDDSEPIRGVWRPIPASSRTC
jgi:chemotaxis methyl-accepting protein methylase